MRPISPCFVQRHEGTPVRFVLVDDEVYLPKDDFIRVTRFCFISPDGDWRKDHHMLSDLVIKSALNMVADDADFRILRVEKNKVAEAINFCSITALAKAGVKEWGRHYAKFKYHDETLDRLAFLDGWLQVAHMNARRHFKLPPEIPDAIVQQRATRWRNRPVLVVNEFIYDTECDGFRYAATVEGISLTERNESLTELVHDAWSYLDGFLKANFPYLTPGTVRLRFAPDEEVIKQNPAWESLVDDGIYGDLEQSFPAQTVPVLEGS